MRRAARVDSNHGEVGRAFRKLGYSTKDVSQLKKFCDWVVAKNNRSFLIEVKDGDLEPARRKLTPGEKEFHDYWEDEVYIIESLEDVVEFDKSVREMAHFQGSLRIKNNLNKEQ